MSLKVMLIDDNSAIRGSASAALKKQGYEVYTVDDGFAAMSVIADTRPDVIFVDVMAPRLNGYQTCQLIKNNSHFKCTPVIMLSNTDGLFDKARGRVAGAQEYMRKPFSTNELLDAVNRHI